MPSNHLISEKSPYLLQHADNPVNWYAWSDAAFEQARRKNKPIFLSIGYATCHWCHVMAHESFEDPTVAGYLNDTFICIKVDREERPDIDALYMTACQMLAGNGGWPLNICMTPDKQPFFAATYMPKDSRFGRIGVIDLCQRVAAMWDSQPDKITESAGSITHSLSRAFEFKAASDLDEPVLSQAYDEITKSYDTVFGGFLPPPKFPTPHRMLFLLRYYHHTGDTEALEMVQHTLRKMRLGGIWDHVGFGFHRYSTDALWLVPHFEKMLYDQALLAQTYLEAYQISKDPFWAQTAREIFTYVLRDMTSPEGGFYSADDADSEGEEGKFYVWSLEEFRHVLETDGDIPWETLFNLKSEGKFEEEATRQKTGTNILHLTQDLLDWAAALKRPHEDLQTAWENVRQKLFAARAHRIPPLRDDKILTDWNGLMITALALGGRILEQPLYTRAAQKAADFILTRLRTPDGRLWHRFREGEALIAAHADDYAFMVMGLLELYQSTFDLNYLEHAVALQQTMLDDFEDARNGGFFLTAADQKELPIRPKALYDGAIPSANSVALLNLLRLFRLTGAPHWETAADRQVKSFAGSVAAMPSAFTYFLLGVDFMLHPGQEVVIAGDLSAATTQSMLQALDQKFTPNKVTLVKSNENAARLAQLVGFTDGLQLVQGQTTAHVCRGFACKEATTDVTTMLQQIGKKRS